MATTVTALSLLSTKFRPDVATADDKVSLVIAGIAGGIAVAVFEELGWSGVALPRLRAGLGVVATGLVMGLLWSVWHFPLFGGTTDPEGTVPRVVLVVVLLFAWLTPYRLLMVWLYDRTESLPLAMLMHAPIAAGALILATEDASGTATMIQVLTWGAIYWAIVGVIASANGGHLTRGQDRAPAGPPMG
jgi:membrane protease YdiL (CAAX protease family)